ncbi:MAG: hypothetical protein HYZ83_07175 [Candidatus Omnitrophica bacterium]|nr:hypothetical protein [Candidatus Omnitrophota bacterium]
MIEGLRLLKNTVLQSLFFTGHHMQNTGEEAVREWIQAVGAIQPEFVQVYSLGRSPKDSRILPVSRKVLDKISEQLTEETGVPSSVFE